jgi:hypothetical protein
MFRRVVKHSGRALRSDHRDSLIAMKNPGLVPTEQGKYEKTAAIVAGKYLETGRREHSTHTSCAAVPILRLSKLREENR